MEERTALFIAFIIGTVVVHYLRYGKGLHDLPHAAVLVAVSLIAAAIVLFTTAIFSLPALLLDAFILYACIDLGENILSVIRARIKPVNS